MPPKKSEAAVKANPQNDAEAKGDSNDGSNARPKSNSKKRKAPPTTSQQPSAGSRRSARSAPSAPADPVKMLNYLISPASLAASRPKDEASSLETYDSRVRTYSSSDFTPFEELASAVILSRPIGHMLGLRSIRTLFNEPYSLVTPKAIRDLGKEGCREALDAAKTRRYTTTRPSDCSAGKPTPGSIARDSIVWIG